MRVLDICRLSPVIPVLTVSDVEQAAPMARALVAGGLKALEVTLRTPAALEAVSAMAKAAPEAVVGAGTLRTPEDIRKAKAAGARFGVSPGATEELLSAARAEGLDMLPGVATVSEAMRWAEDGYRTFKFFPAGPAGGVAMLKAWQAPLPDLSFCPTGGVSLETASDYLALANVVCVGGSWVVPADALAAGDWARVEALAREAAALGR